MKKVFSVVFKMIFILCITLLILLSTFVKTNEGITNKYLFYQITTGSMEGDVSAFEIGSINVSDIIVVQRNLSSEFFLELRVGDVITFEMNSGNMIGHVITHRIIEINEIDSYYKITTKGDNSDNVEVLYSNIDIIYGNVVLSNSFLGLVFNVITNHIFLIVCIIIPCIIIVLYEVKKILKNVSENNSRRKI